MRTTQFGESIDESVDQWVTAKRPMDGKCQPTAEYIGTFTERINGGESAHACAHHRLIADDESRQLIIYGRVHESNAARHRKSDT